MRKPCRSSVPLALAVGALLVILSSCSTEGPSGTVTLPPTTIQVETAVPPAEPTGPPAATPEAIIVKPGMDLATLVDEGREGDTFLLLAGIHRGFEIVPKDDMSFVGERGAVLNGAVVLSGFISDGETWQLAGIVPEGRDHGQCLDGYEGCFFSQDLFMDDVMLWQVTELDDLKEGSWFREGDVVYVKDDPTKRRVELSTVTYAFVGAANNVEIRGLVVEKYATPAQDGAIQSQMPGQGEKGSYWTIVDVEVSGVHGAGIRAGDNMVIRDSLIHRNGQLGVTGAGVLDLLIEDSVIEYNNTAGFRWQWEAGGVKVTNSDGVVFRGNTVRYNNGPGLWADLDTVDVLYEGNTVVGNAGPGIFHEISGKAVIRNNTVERNGYDQDSWLWGSGILVAASSDVDVYDNIVLDNANGIGGIQQDRGTGTYGPRLLVNLHVYRNTIRLAGGRVGVVEDVGDETVFTERNNRFEANTYIGETGRDYFWKNRRITRERWIASGQDVEGVWR